MDTAGPGVGKSLHLLPWSRILVPFCDVGRGPLYSAPHFILELGQSTGIGQVLGELFLGVGGCSPLMKLVGWMFCAVLRVPWLEALRGSGTESCPGMSPEGDQVMQAAREELGGSPGPV